MQHFEKTVKSEKIFEGEILSVLFDEVEIENGRNSTREHISHNGGAAVIALDNEGFVYLVEQFRYPYKKVLLEVAAGKLKLGEDPLECGKRELWEETGIKAKNYTSLGEVYPTPGYSNEIIYLYLATELEFGEQNCDEDEFVTVNKMSLDEAVKMVLSGAIKDSKTQIAILKTKEFKE